MAEELKHLHLALERQKLSLDVLHRRQAELSEENAALRDCLESIGVLCGQAFLSRLHRRRFQRVLSQHPLSRSSVGLEALMQTPELAVNIAAFAGPRSSATSGLALCKQHCKRVMPCAMEWLFVTLSWIASSPAPSTS
ncbi:Uncharacterized protein SCF082_LOCUS12102 [Durusdinium trenchii]|uniref:Uncharacterized protein n=1 Tax=Durusdinium trenchii TaxID=1381693 RepID=A0ABP0JHG9_9DINO